MDASVVGTAILDVVARDEGPKREDVDLVWVVEFDGLGHSDEDEDVVGDTTAEGVESTSMVSGALDVIGAGICSIGAGVCGVAAVRPRFNASRIVSKSSFARLLITGGTDWKVCRSAAISFGGLSAR